MVTTRISNIAVKLASLYQLATPGGWGKIEGRPTLSHVIEHVRKRWRLRILLTGLFWILAIGTVVIIASAWLLNHWHFTTPAVWFLRLVTIFSLAGLSFHFFIKPLRRQVSDASVALYLEEHEPNLTSIILSAVDAGQSDAKDLSPQLVGRLVEQSLDASQRVNYGHDVEQQKLRRAAFKPGLALVLILALFIFPAEFLRNGVPVLLMPWADAGEYSPYRLELSPGNIEIARGSDQLISARIIGFEVEQASLFTSDDDGASWRPITMTSGAEAGLYESFLFDLNANLNYFVKAAGLQSETFRIEVADIPAISDISLRYHFPAYTMLEPKITQGSGDIAALRGTRVEVQIKPTIAIPGGELVLENGETIDLVKQDAESWVADITVDKNSSYKVTLQRASGKLSDASPEFRISALDDKHPSVSIRSPGRDVKVSVIEEAMMKIRAQDDQGIASLEIVLSVNGEDEQKINLMPEQDSNNANSQIDAEHTIFLENLQLRPGDLISYYVQAKDRAQTDDSRTSTSDMFFYQVRPFRTDYYQSDQGGGGGGGQQGGQQDGFLAEQQKQFVVATFKMIRDREKFSEETYQDNLELLAKAQSRIRDRVEAIIRRIGNRAMLQMDNTFQVVAEELPLAANAMIEVEKKLQESQINTALSDAQVALQHLQRADAAFRKVNLALNNAGGGSGGNNANVEDLANLFKLEMDKLKHQYETVQRGQQQSSAELIDETLERLRELARRQQQQVEQLMRRQDQAINNGASEKELALANQLEEMARQLEKLSRNQQNQQLQQSISQMKAAAEAMRRAAGTASSGASTASGGIGQARQAVENLREAQRLLDQSRIQQFSTEVERTLDLAEQVENKQAEIKQEVFQMEKDYGDAFKAQLNQVENHKQELTRELEKLEGELNSLTTAAREEQPEAAQSLKQAIRTAREYRLNDRIQRSRDMLLLSEKKHAIDNEIEIQNGIRTVREHIENALDNVREQNPGGLERSLDRMRALARELRLIRQRGSTAASNQGSGTADANQLANGDYQPLQQELEGIAAQASDLKRGLLNQGVAAGDIDPVLAMINQLSQDGRDINTTTDLHDQALSALMELEYKLRKQHSPTDFPELLISEPTDLPEGYKDMVADYYRELSRTK
jgi:hypothetical protein